MCQHQTFICKVYGRIQICYLGFAYLLFLLSKSMGGSPSGVDEVPVTYVKQRKGCRMSCDVGQATEELEIEL